MKNKERIIWIGSLAIFLAFSLLVVLQYQTKLRNTEQKKISLSNDNTQLQQQHRDYATQVAEKPFRCTIQQEDQRPLLM